MPRKSACLRRRGYAWSFGGGLLGFGADRQLHLKGCALTKRRFNPDASTVHLDDLLGDGEPEASAALGLGIGAVNLVELLEDALQLFLRYPWTRVCHGDSEVA